MNNKKIIIYFFALVLIRTFTVFFIDKTPCMDTHYFSIGAQLAKGSIETIQLSPTYSIGIYFLTSFFGSLFLASSIVYIIFSILACVYIYLLAKYFFSEKIALYSIFISMFLPNLTVSVAGYSHSVVVGFGLELAGIYYLIRSFDSFDFIKLLTGITFSVLAIFIRPEYLIVNVVLFTSLWIYQIFVQKRINTMISFGFIYFAIVILFVCAHAFFVQSICRDNSYSGAFTDKRYSYMTMIHTYSLRYANVIDDSTAIEISKKYIGTPIENKYSIKTLILKNPKQFITNVLYNVKELIDVIAHPLFMPFYLLILFGFLIHHNKLSNFEKKAYVLIGTIVVLHILPLLLFHIEIRYLLPVSALLVIVIAKSISLHKNAKGILIITNILNFIIYVAYAINFRSLNSLCF